MNYRIINGLLLLADGDGFQLKQEELFVNGTKIEAIGRNNIKNLDTYEEIDAHNNLIIPGLINTHTHVYMNFMKNAADDIPFNSWLFDRIFPIEAKMKKADFYWTTLFGCIEMIQSGTTAYLDMHICEDACAEAAGDSGMRAFLGKCLTGTDLYTDGYESFKNALREKDRYESELLQFVLSPHSIYTCSEKMLRQLSDEAQKRNMLKHIHLSESKKETDECFFKHGKSPVEFLFHIGFLDNRTIAAHCVRVDDNDIHLLYTNGVNVATNPSSNAKLGNGIAPIASMLKKGVNVSLGTDSAASNNTLNMFREMGLFSLLHKAANETATGFSAREVFKCATTNPAKALHMEGKIGILSEGAFADLVFIDLKSPSLFPNNDIIASLCYSANGSEVNSVMINGRFVMRKGRLSSIDSERVYYEVNRITDKYIERRGR